MNGFFSPSQLPIIVGAGAVIAILTLAVALTIGRFIARRSRALAILACTLLWPSMPLAWVIVAIQTHPPSPPPNDAPAMAFVSAAVLMILGLPFSLVTSLVVLLRRRPRSAP